VLIVGVTVSATPADRERCLAAGMDDCLAKPFSMKELAAVARPVLDPRVVGRMERLGRAAGEDLMGQLAQLFLADADARIVALRRAAIGADAPAVVRAAHALHGASANVGAIDLADLCGTFATDGAAGRLEGRGVLLDAVEAELVRVRSALATRTWAP
jgi:HPt (histidine-containing phosphotransfer) domain-containing protein